MEVVVREVVKEAATAEEAMEVASEEEKAEVKVEEEKGVAMAAGRAAEVTVVVTVEEATEGG